MRCLLHQVQDPGPRTQVGGSVDRNSPFILPLPPFLLKAQERSLYYFLYTDGSLSIPCNDAGDSPHEPNPGIPWSVSALGDLSM